MGEKTHLPQENNAPKQNNENIPMEEEEYDDVEDMTSEEFQVLDSQLDALNSALDHIEEKNDNIHERLLQLLQSNREIRKQLQESNAAASAATTGESSQQQNQ